MERGCGIRFAPAQVALGALSVSTRKQAYSSPLELIGSNRRSLEPLLVRGAGSQFETTSGLRHCKAGHPGKAGLAANPFRAVLDDLTLTPLFLAEVVSIAAAGKEISGTKMGVLREVVHLPEADPTHRGALASAPLLDQADNYLMALASAMTSNGQTQALEPEAKQVMNQKLQQMREMGGAEGAATSLHILNALSDHHVLDRVEYPEVTYRFEHQQMQEYYAAEIFKQEFPLWLPELAGDSSLDEIAKTEGAKNFQIKYVNQSSWSEPLRMVMGDMDSETLSSGPADSWFWRRLSRLLALEIDLIFAAELFGLCSTEVQALVAEKLSSIIRQRWNSPANMIVLTHWQR